LPGKVRHGRAGHGNCTRFPRLFGSQAKRYAKPSAPTGTRMCYAPSLSRRRMSTSTLSCSVPGGSGGSFRISTWSSGMSESSPVPTWKK